VALQQRAAQTADRAWYSESAKYAAVDRRTMLDESNRGRHQMRKRDDGNGDIRLQPREKERRQQTADTESDDCGGRTRKKSDEKNSGEKDDRIVAYDRPIKSI
jgi:hypothetical protein